MSAPTRQWRNVHGKAVLVTVYPPADAQGSTRGVSARPKSTRIQKQKAVQGGLATIIREAQLAIDSNDPRVQSQERYRRKCVLEKQTRTRRSQAVRAPTAGVRPSTTGYPGSIPSRKPLPALGGADGSHEGLDRRILAARKKPSTPLGTADPHKGSQSHRQGGTPAGARSGEPLAEPEGEARPLA